jgi:catechol 2,3-dioxygenase-like lactoylglutathione lyase family enzyme
VSSVESIEVAATGQRLVFRDSTAEAVVFESILPPLAPGLAACGPEQEQRFQVLTGSLCFSVGGTETLLTAGGRLTVPRGTTCRYWNSGTEPSHLVAEIRPGLEFERYARAQSTKENAMELTHAYAKLPVQDVERARGFYRDVLGLEPYAEVHGHLYYDVAGVPLLLFPSSGYPSGDHDQFGLVVDDHDAALARLREHGVELEGDVLVREHMRAAWFKDTEGNLVSVAQFAGGSPFRTT